MNNQDVQRLFNEKTRFAAHAGVEMVEISPGAATCRMAMGEGHLNPFGTANAGAVSPLAETAYGATANTLGNTALAVNLSIACLRPAEGKGLTATAKELSAGGGLSAHIGH